MLGVPLVVTFHGADCTVSRRSLWRSGKLYNYRFLLREGRLKREAALFVAVSDFIRGRLIDRGYPAGRVIKHYIGVDTERFRPGRDGGGEPYVLSVARHVAKKGIDVLLRAFARLATRHPSLLLLQVGAGPLTGQLQALTRALGTTSRVRFLGAQAHERVTELMQGARALVLSSRTTVDGDSEGLGIVINEASACGVPVVATRHGGIPEAVVDGETGFLIAEGDDAALSDRLDALLSDMALARRMGRRGREYVSEMFNIRKQTRALEVVYDEVLQRCAGS
jgi:glycosyltransferase involved in cell wall biosynthesis